MSSWWWLESWVLVLSGHVISSPVCWVAWKPVKHRELAACPPKKTARRCQSQGSKDRTIGCKKEGEGWWRIGLTNPLPRKDKHQLPSHKNPRFNMCLRKPDCWSGRFFFSRDSCSVGSPMTYKKSIWKWFTFTMAPLRTMGILRHTLYVPPSKWNLSFGCIGITTFFIFSIAGFGEHIPPYMYLHKTFWNKHRKDIYKKTTTSFCNHLLSEYIGQQKTSNGYTPEN